MQNYMLLIKNWLRERRLQKVIGDCKAKNPNPRIYKVWEHKGWGDRISVRCVNQNGTFEIYGHLTPKPIEGDYIIYECQSGKKGKGIVIRTKYPGDPLDMFFATVLPIEYYLEKD